MNNIARLRKGLSPERQRKIAVRTATIVAEEHSLQELRRAHKSATADGKRLPS